MLFEHAREVLKRNGLLVEAEFSDFMTGWSVGGIFGPLIAATFVGTNLYIVLAVLYFIAFTAMEIFVRK